MIRPDPSKIIVPRKHGELLIEPSLQQLAGAVASRPTPPDEREEIRACFRMSDSQMRVAARQALVDAATRHAAAIGETLPPFTIDAPWIITGHQLEFYHPGVWAKVLAADALAQLVRANGESRAIAIDMLVDHDLVERLGLEVPARSANGAWQREEVHFAESSSLPAEDLQSPKRKVFEVWDAAIARYPVAQSDAMAFFLSELRPLGGQTYAAWMSRARARFERSFDLQVVHVPTSGLCTGPAWDAFVGGWIEFADRFTTSYNNHLAAYRHRQQIKSPQHPMPDLERQTTGASAGLFELPFWIHRPGEPRQRMRVRVRGPQVVVLAGEKEYAWQPGGGIAGADFSIRPRALTLTMYVRLFLADVFIHGIGGALYDQITDAIMQELFGSVPPYGCVSAAWFLPLASGEMMHTEDLASLRWQRHHVFHNPQLAIDPFTALRTDVAELITERKRLVQQIAASLQTSRSQQHAQRREWFDRLHAVNRTLHEKSPKMIARIDEEIESAKHAAEQRKVLEWREWFFGLQTRDALATLLHKVHTHGDR